MKLRFNELDFISDSELETMSLPIAYLRIIKYSEFFKNFRKNINVNIGFQQQSIFYKNNRVISDGLVTRLRTS